VGVLLIASPAQGEPWIFSPELQEMISAASVQDLPREINSPQDLQDLLSDLSYLREFSRLSARFVEGQWRIEGELAAQISDFSFRYQPSELYEVVTAISQKYLGEISSPEIIKQCSEELRQRVSQLGYLNNQVEVEVSIDKLAASYLVSIASGPRCEISRISADFPLPEGLEFGLKVGDTCRSEELNRSFEQFAEQLKKLGYLEARVSKKALRYSADKSSAEVELHGSLGRKITYSLHNKRQSWLESLLGFNGILPGVDYSILDREEFIRALGKLYRAAGFFDFAVVKNKITHSSADELNYQLVVDPGVEYSLTDVSFVGSAAFARKELFSTMGLSNFLGDFYNFSQDKIETAVSRILQLYQQNGFWDAEVKASITKQNPQAGTVNLLVKITEKSQRHLRSLELQGNQAVSSDVLRGLASFALGAALSKEQLYTFESAIKSHYARLGFSNTDVLTQISVPMRSRSNEQLEVKVIISEGQRERVGKIKVVGLEKTRKNVIMRELIFHAGEWYDPEKINKSRTALLRLGIFSEVRISPLHSNNLRAQGQRDVDIIIEVKEGFAGNVVHGPGYDLIRGISYMTQVSYNNLFGSGRRLSVRGSLSQERSQQSISEVGDKDRRGSEYIGRKLGLGFVEPYVFGLPAEGAINLSYKGIADQFRQTNFTSEVAIAYSPTQLPGRNTLTPFANLQISTSEGTITQRQSLVVTGGSRIFRSGLRLKTDQRNEIDWPTAGFLSKLNVAWANYLLQTDYRFFQWSFTHNAYLALGSRMVWVNGISLAAYEEVKSRQQQNLPSTERLFAGGPDMVRGFSRQLGPYVATEASPAANNLLQGGSRRLVVKSDLRYKFSDKWGGSLFADCGNSFFTKRELQVFKENYAQSGNATYEIEDNFDYAFHDLFRYPTYLWSKNFLSYGISASYITPLGPALASIAWPWHEPKSAACKEQDKCYARSFGPEYYLSIGTEF
jgi:outer membrane protein assembly complex protein YaeT